MIEGSSHVGTWFTHMPCAPSVAVTSDKSFLVPQGDQDYTTFEKIVYTEKGT